jgi:hypothetical protein
MEPIATVFCTYFLPDFLLDHTLLGKDPAERIGEFWRRWVQFLAGFWLPESANQLTLALRYDWDATARAVSVSFAYRTANSSSPNLSPYLERGLRTFGFEPTRRERDQQRSLRNLPHVCEVRSAEAAVSIRSADQRETFVLPNEFILGQRSGDRELYQLTSWWGPGDSFLMPFHILAAQTTDVSICVLLQPTHLTESESQLLAAIARCAESLAQVQTSGDSIGSVQLKPSQNQTDPQLRYAARLYAAHLRRLTHPFLAVMYCFGADANGCQQVAAAWASALREEQPFAPPAGESDHLPAGAEVIVGDENSAPLMREMATLVRLNHLGDTRLYSLLPSDRNHPLNRLRYLVDARGAACVFRPPINVRGGIPGFVVKQRPPDFIPGPGGLPTGERLIRLGHFHSGDVAAIDVQAFTKHALVVGFTGSGKTNTVLWLLRQFWKYRIPFLVIESAKKEYRGLRNVSAFQNPPKLRIYTLGNEVCAPLRLNPFEVLPGVRVEAHLTRLQTCFEAALPPVGPLPSIIAETLEKLYRRAGWAATDTPQPGSGDPRQFPTMRDFYDMVQEVTRARGYQGDVKSNVEAAITGRIKPLLFGSKGALFGDRHSNPDAHTLFTTPTILELNDLNETDKSLVVMFVLTMLRAYREQNAKSELQHITVVEEAHNVLENLTPHGGGESESSDVKAKAVQTLCNMLTEVRAYGEGIIIADQSPEKLARDALRNTNVQIAHQLRDAHDRAAVAAAMIMDEEQRDFLGKIEPGHAALFVTGLQKATFVRMPNYKDVGPKPYEGFNDAATPTESDAQVRAWMREMAATTPATLSCQACQHAGACANDRRQTLLTTAEIAAQEFQNLLAQLGQTAHNQSGAALFAPFAALLASTLRAQASDAELAWCSFRHLYQRYRDEPLDTRAWRNCEQNFRDAYRALRLTTEAQS